MFYGHSPRDNKVNNSIRDNETVVHYSQAALNSDSSKNQRLRCVLLSPVLVCAVPWLRKWVIIFACKRWCVIHFNGIYSCAVRSDAVSAIFYCMCLRCFAVEI